MGKNKLRVKYVRMWERRKCQKSVKSVSWVSQQPLKQKVMAYSCASVSLVCFNGTLYPIFGTGVQETTIEVSVTSVLKNGAFPIGWTKSQKIQDYCFSTCSQLCDLWVCLEVRRADRNSLVAKVTRDPSLSTLPLSACRVAVYSVSGCKLRRVYCDKRAGIRSCLGFEPSTVRKSL